MSGDKVSKGPRLIQSFIQGYGKLSLEEWFWIINYSPKLPVKTAG